MNFLLRFHVSDPVRQLAPLRRMIGERNSYVSIVGQPPANGARVALEAWHIGGMLGKRRRAEPGGAVVEALRAHYRLFLAGKREFSAPDSCGQMREEFPLAGPDCRLTGGSRAGFDSPHLDLLPGH